MHKEIPYIDEINLEKKRVLIRADFNVPLGERGSITDDTRIRAVLPTINYALDYDARIILASHMGRPEGRRVDELSLAPVAKRLARLLEKDVIIAPDCVGKKVEDMVDRMKDGDVMLLENLRFHSGEESNDDTFGKKLARLADVYINDAFATAHRAHASNIAITRYVRECAAGLLMKKELSYFSRAMDDPVRPLVSIVGGKKVSDKIGLLESLCERADKLIVGGGMALTFFKSLGYEVGKSFVDEGSLQKAQDVIEKTHHMEIKFYLPVDFVVADRFDKAAETKVVTYQEIPKGWLALDIGPASVRLFSEAIQDARTIVWNGPMGVFEIDAFSRGTFAMVANVANTYALTIVGGGDTDVAVHRAGEFAKMSYISTGGGAFLKLIEGKTLPAIKALYHCN